jgi:hypothetical protein
MKLIKKSATISAATLLAWLVAGIASAQTTTNNIAASSTVQGAVNASSSTPGIPNTGAGDVLANVFLLATSAAIALIGLAYLSRKWANS